MDAPSLASRLEDHGLGWKSYQQSLPYAGLTGTCYPCNASDPSSLYASKHNGFLNFLSVQNNPAEMAKSVPIEQLQTDLDNDTAPTFSFIVPDQCHDMQGTNDCPDSATNIKVGDAYASGLVHSIMSSATWRDGLNAIVITWDLPTVRGASAPIRGGGGRCRP